ncbi:hypothetical protein C8A00DRAFT_39884 [Chaetomidium leptoderma]|uniref:Uncharacterized protein n=1 Tax=Chaetomidium leptoderma TaxID=669021 RepID=A0AAN6VUM5_9PEZI|nr:hypothetical protein C8A00DRAFT_39884 [Chaetomidium leptoderma]
MAKAGSSINPAAWTSWSPDESTSRTKIHRRYVQVPSDQQKLLERPDAWSVGGFPRVPSTVLEDVSARYARETRPRSRPRSEVERKALSSQPASPVQTTRGALSSQPASPVHLGRAALSSQAVSPARSTPTCDRSSKTSVGVEGGIDEDHWSSSPSAHFRSPCRQTELATAASTPSRRPFKQHKVWDTGQATARVALPTDFPPSSSAASELGLDVEVPGAITDVPEPVNRGLVAALEPTPPSAQIIPCTLTERTSPVTAPEPGHRRRMQHPAAVFGSLGSGGQKHASTVALSKTGTAVLLRSPSSVASSPPSISGVHAENEHVSAPKKEPDTVPATSQLAINQGSSNDANKLPPNGPSSQVPFTAFRVAYPDYKGTLGDFIRGVMYILQLQKDRALIEFLYDDVVRAFAGGYLDYIRDLGDNGHALSAIQWYNENVSRPLYTKGILTKDNVKDVAMIYPEKTRAIQQNLEQSETEARRRPAKQTPHTAGGGKPIAQRPLIKTGSTHARHQSGIPSAASSTSPGLVTHTATGPQPMQENLGIAARPANSTGMSRLSPPSLSRVRTSRPASIVENTVVTTPEAMRTQVDSSLPDIEPSPTPWATEARLPVASTLQSTTLSQLSNTDSIPEATLKRKAGPRASAVSSVGEPGAEFKRRKKVAKDPEERALERALRFRKFLTQKLTQSSAPGGSTAS